MEFRLSKILCKARKCLTTSELPMLPLVRVRISVSTLCLFYSGNANLIRMRTLPLNSHWLIAILNYSSPSALVLSPSVFRSMSYESNVGSLEADIARAHTNSFS